MPVNSESIRRSIREFDFKRLFIEELNWDRLRVRPPIITVDGSAFTLTPIAEKRGFQIFQCSPDKDGKVPDDKLRRKIDRELTKLADQHLLVFTDEARTIQKWQWAKREQNRLIALRTETYQRGETGERLAQKLQHLYISLEEEPDLAITSSSGKVKKGFDVDRVTKRFYEQFKKVHDKFLNFIKGIQDQADKEWYASLMLNRLMFIRFIQEKRFLADDPNYLRNRLNKLQAQKGRNRFHSFYRYFLLRLFHEGLGSQKRDDELDALLGKVPYLNGGLFDIHELEQDNSEIQIADEAFEKVFDFFDEWDWLLDDRPLKDQREINPDVLGYIFEKYINQKQMGAYYTKEDITGYISKNTIIPFLFDAARKRCPIAFEPDSALWRLLKENPDRYIYNAVRIGVIDKQGNIISLPAEIEAGINDVSKREGWNKPADDEFALPTENWREHVQRRKRCLEIREKLKAGEVHSINDLITYNLDIRQFAQDAIDNCEGVDLLRAFYRVIAGHIPHNSNEKFETGMSILDPTCGSGAFLFAALNILEPLYDACLNRMQGFIDESSSEKQYPDFRRIIERVEKHPSRRYFILKSIIIGNLYGVDIMEEAAEICKLRLFLKLVAQLERPEQIEPLPDIDFNIRAGNTLVGFATQDEAKRSVDQTQTGQGKIQFENLMKPIAESAEIAARAYEKFREMQMAHDMDAEAFHEAKENVRRRLRDLDEELDRYLAGEYGVNPDKAKEFQAWRKSHQPFHWFVEFYSIMKNGGFDVIIGNPPWKEYSAVKKTYTVSNYLTESCGNLHGICTERALNLRSGLGRLSFIVQLPLASSSRMSTVRNLLKQRSQALHAIPFDDRPGKLFEGLQNCRSVIFSSQAIQNQNSQLLATARYQRWPSSLREFLFPQFEFARILSESIYPDQFPKYANNTEEGLFRKIKNLARKVVAESLTRNQSEHFIFYQEATRYWIKATFGLPYYSKNNVVGAPAHGRYLYFENAETAHAVCALLNSSLFYVYFIAYGDCFHLSDQLVSGFPVTASLLADKSLSGLNQKLMIDLKKNAERKTINTSDGDKITYAEFYGAKSKPIIDEIDRALAKHYGFTDEELDFIINYDIKYRMGRDMGEEGE